MKAIMTRDKQGYPVIYVTAKGWLKLKEMFPPVKQKAREMQYNPFSGPLFSTPVRVVKFWRMIWERLVLKVRNENHH